MCAVVVVVVVNDDQNDAIGHWVLFIIIMRWTVSGLQMMRFLISSRLDGECLFFG
jgi:hypothetical protein